MGIWEPAAYVFCNARIGDLIDPRLKVGGLCDLLTSVHPGEVNHFAERIRTKLGDP